MLRQLQARRFRNLEILDFEPGRGFQLLIGGTGAGKTSVLEAAYVACTTRSFRTARLVECVRSSASATEGFELAAEIEAGRRVRLQVSWLPETGLDRTLNGSRVPLADHVGAQPILVWSSADVEMVLGSLDLRRRFLDRGILARSPQRLEVYSRYRKALSAKRALLHRGGGVDRTALTSWNQVLARAAIQLVQLRREYVVDLQERLEPVILRSGLDLVGFSLRYSPSPTEASEGETSLFEALERLATREIDRRRPLAGPHRDRLQLRWRETQLEHIASAGERKAAGLLLLAAQVGTLLAVGREPLVLVDDIDTELDQRTLEGIVSVLQESPQLLASSNRPEVFSGVAPAAVWGVVRGVVRRS